MTKPQKILTIALWIVAVGGMVGVVAMRTIPAGNGAAAPATQPDDAVVARVISDPADSEDAPLKLLYPAPNFSLTDQDAKPLTSKQLLGKPWIADFFFTSCGSLCPIMSAHMAEFQDRLPSDVRLVSFTVDPSHDTPAVLKTYGQQFHAQDGRWFFLTGDENTINDVGRGLKAAIVPAQGQTPVQHDEHFILVDGQGNVRGVYDSLVEQDVKKLLHDANSLVSQPTASGGAQANGIVPNGAAQ